MNEPRPDGRETPSPADPPPRDRAAHPRRTPGRTPVGWPVTLRWIRLTAGAVVGATVVLVAVLVLGQG